MDRRVIPTVIAASLAIHLQIACSTEFATARPSWKFVKAEKGRADFVSSAGSEMEFDWQCEPDANSAARLFDAWVGALRAAHQRVRELDQEGTTRSFAALVEIDGRKGGLVAGIGSRITFIAGCAPLATDDDVLSWIESARIAAQMLDAAISLGEHQRLCPVPDLTKGK